MRISPLRRPGRPAAAAALLLAAALTVSGCSADPDGDGKAGASAPASPGLSAAERVEKELDAPAEETPQPQASEASQKPKKDTVTDGKLKPATGSFSKKEKEYLSGRVPESVEPAAVLDLGRESCQRIERTAKHDKDAAAAAVVAGDVRDAEDAVTHLCPEQQPVLDAAEGGYADGTHEKPAPGRYRTASSGPSCTWQVTDAKGGILTSGPAPGAKDGQHTLTIPSGAAGFESSGCYAWLRA
ncbi:MULTISPECIES: hypothetical protein [unclassified Streptomyces]|uniref:hypothetical protein n=1 Tax=unclassified Streptomyces TaxID=2593676 RepID=UPI0008DDD225|nr:MULTISPECIES: hypothetical protein [unclassified Streptomyces]OII60730.1 hypothetical protein BJP39_10780 [Streptomyces sp. CC77]